MPRKLAYEILKKIENNGQYSNIAIDSALKGSGLEKSDRALASTIVLGVIERRITLDYIIKKILKNFDKTDKNILIILRIGLYQMMFLDRIPTYAAVNETVRLAPKKFAGLVNAVLRAYERQKDKIDYPNENTDIYGYLSVKYSFPEEICHKFTDIYGTGRTKNIFEIFNRPSKTALRINTLKVGVDEYIRELGARNIDYEPSGYLPYIVMVNGCDVESLPGFEEGEFFVQDTASALCVEALGAEESDFLIDSCACPGSKSFGSAILMNNKGLIYSCDLHQSKLGLINSGADRLGIGIIETMRKDGGVFDISLEGKADKVLCDVPCSGFGVIGKKPEIRYKKLSDTEKLPDIQYRILENCSRYVKNGGTLVYSTCTVIPEENLLNIERFLASHKDFALCDFNVGGLASKGGILELAPDINDTDGFFICKMKKIN